MGSCAKDDDSWSDNYEMSFFDFETDSEGWTKYAVDDNGQSFIIDNPLSGLKSDTTYRFIALYVRNNQRIKISSCAHAVSSLPVPLVEGDLLHTDPVRIQSIWRVRNYINATLSVPIKDKQHFVKFVEKQITTNNDGEKIVHIQLFHDSNNDVAGSHTTVYLSLPLRTYNNQLTQGKDSIYFSINTPEGNITYPYLF